MVPKGLCVCCVCVCMCVHTVAVAVYMILCVIERRERDIWVFTCGYVEDVHLLQILVYVK